MTSEQNVTAPDTGEWWRQLVESAPDAILVHCRGRIVFANQRAAELFAAPDPGALLGRRAVSLLHPDHVELSRRRMRRVVRTRKAAEPREIRYRRLDGSAFWGEGRITFVRYRGRPALLVIVRDISGRVANEQRFRDFAELASDWFWEMGPDLRYTWFSENVELITGVPAAWHYGKTRLEIAGPGVDPRALAAHVRVLEERRPYRDFDFCRRGPSGDHWIRSNGKPVYDEDGRFLGYRGTGRDITAVKRAEIALRESEERYRRLVELSPDAVLIHERGVITFANPRAAEMLGLSGSEALIGRAVLDFVDERDRERLRSRWRGLRRIGDSVPPLELRVRRADGTMLYVESRGSLIHDRGRPVVLVVARDVTARKQAEERLTYLARHDPLTRLANRALVLERLQQAVRGATERGHQAALLLVDLDGFKGINDSFGHQFGDLVIAAVARRLEADLRDCDTVGRLGGDEFAIVLPKIASPAAALAIGGRIAESLARPITAEDRACRIAASVGLAIAPDHADNATELMRCADLALYTAKAQRRGSVVAFDPAMRRALEDRRTIEQALRRHLAENTLEVWYQPVVELASGRIVGAEALARWPSGEAERIPPDVFVSVAEECGLIAALGRHVLQTACTDARRWCGSGDAGLHVAVNISPQELADPDLAGWIRELLARTSLPGDRLQLEITERVLLERTGTIAETLAELDTLGVQLAIDDFGTGYSSLAYLKRFPVHRLKLDRSFVSGLPNDAEDSAIVRAIVGLADAFQLPLVAEGVERREQAECLRELGVRDGQGYLWSRPLPRLEFEKLLATWSADAAAHGGPACEPGLDRRFEIVGTPAAG